MALRILQGRAFAFSPEWSDEGASVLFDRNSGDYWVLSSLAREITRHAASAGPLDAPALIRHIDSRTDVPDLANADETTIRRVIDELVQLSILAHT